MPQSLFSPAATARYVAQAAQQTSAPPAAATPPKTGMDWPAVAVMLGGQGADAATTLAALHTGRFHETNPQPVPLLMAEKAGIVTLGMLLGHHLPHRTADVLGYVIGAAGGVPAAMNLYHLMHTQDPQR